MKLEEMLLEENMKGSYAGVRFDTETNKAIHKYMSDNKLPVAVRPDRLHSTLLYSRKYLPKYKPAGKLEKAYVGKPTHFEVWNTRPDDGSKPSRCLVLRYDCPELEERHKALMKEHGATYDFPSYDPHITLSYDIGDMDEKKLPSLADTLKAINIVEEYGEDLDLNWAKNKGTKKGN
jgi:hypothetical protein